MVDIALFAVLLLTLFKGASTLSLLGASVLARFISGIFNFILNQRWVFKSQNTTGDRRRYVALFTFQMVLSAVLLQLVDTFIPHPVPVKIMVDTLIFVGSYLVQKKLVFKSRMEKTHEA